MNNTLAQSINERDFKEGSFILNKLSLTFNKQLELLFLNKYFVNSLIQFRIAFLLDILIYGGFAYLDLLLVPEYVPLFHFIRFAIVIPFCSAVLIFSFFKIFEKVWQQLLMVSHILTGVGLSLMTVLAFDNYSYYAGMVLIFLVGYFLIKLRFLYATIANWIILIFFNVGYMLFADASGIILISYNFIFLCANIIGMLGAYNIELYARRDFYLNKELDKQNELVENSNKQLELQVKERTKELEKAKNEAEKSDKLKSAFLANISHEIRTPINGIFGFTRLLKELNLNEDQTEYIDIIEQSSVRMLNLMNDIIDFSKIESGLISTKIDKSNLSELVKYLFSFFKTETNDKGLQFNVGNSLSGKDIIIETDYEKLYAILTNLIKNAIKFTEKGSVEFGYKVIPNKGKIPLLEFYVKDTGIGVPKDMQKCIFERFRRAEQNCDQMIEGAGLGLSIVKAYIDMLEGEIWLESQEGVGSNFKFTIPYIPSTLKNSINETIIQSNHV